MKMNEKRFNFNLTLGEDEHKGLIFDNEQVMKTIEVVYLLNELLKENEELKHDYGQLQYEMSQIIQEYNKLEKENEQLKKEKEKIKSKAEKFVELYEEDFGKRYFTPPRSGKTVRLQLWIVRKILDELGILELYGDFDD